MNKSNSKLLFAFLALVFFSLQIAAQQELNDDDTGTRTIVYDDDLVREFLVPSNPNHNVLNLELRGGSGGAASVGDCVSKGGTGAIAKVSFLIGNEPNQLPPGTKLRLIAGQGASSANASPFFGVGEQRAGGGGGTAVLAFIDDTWEILAVAGGGGGAHQGMVFGGCVDSKAGQGGRSATDGGPGAGTFGGAAGKNGNGGTGGGDANLDLTDISGAGGGAFSNGSGANNAGGLKGFAAGGRGGVDQDNFITADGLSGGWGFGGGGASIYGGGGGGGYSGGGGGSNLSNGGGGGSYVNADYAFTNMITDGGTTVNRKHGYVKYQFETLECTSSITSIEFINYICQSEGRGRIKIHTDLDPGSVCNNDIEIALVPDLGQQNLGGGEFRRVREGEFKAQLIHKPTGGVISSVPVTMAVDNSSPIAKCKGVSISLTNGSYNNPNFHELINDNSTANCDDPLTLRSSRTQFSCADIGNLNLVTLTVTASNGKQATCGSVVNVNPAPSDVPVAKCKPDFEVELVDGSLALAPADVDNGSSLGACPGASNLTVTPNTFDCNDIGEHIVTLTLQNGNNSAECKTIVTVKDVGLPIAKCKPNVTVTLDDAGLATIAYDIIDNGSISNNCTGLTYSLGKSNFDCSDSGSATLNLSVTDGYGQSASCTAALTVKENTVPIAVCKDITVNLDENGGQTINALELDGGSTDQCNLSFSTTKTTFSCSDVGTLSLILTVEDQSGNQGFCTAQVTVQDKTPPTAICKDFTINLLTTSETLDGLDFYYMSPQSSDQCAGTNLIRSIDRSPIISCEDVGIQEVEVLLTDPSGNTSSCTSMLTITDVRLPLAQCKDAVVALNENGIGTLTPDQLDDGSFDNCGIAELILQKSIFDCSDLGPNTVGLRAIDNSGNRDECFATVEVIKQIGPNALCKDATLIVDEGGNGSIQIKDIDNGSNDACGIGELSLDKFRFSCSDVGLNTVTLTVISVAGSSSSCTATVEVKDEGRPVAQCKDISVAIDESSVAWITPADIDNGSHDACGLSDLSLDESSFICNQTGDHIVTLTVTDNNGNTNSCEATVSVFDLVAPSVRCQDVTIQLDDNGVASLTARDMVQEASDVCGIASVDLDQNDFSCDHVGENTVIATATDLNGNSSKCQATVTVQDLVAPIASCQDVTIQLDEDGQASISPSTIDSGFDACGIADLSLDRTTFSCDDIGTHTVLLSLTDNNGNTNSCKATVNVVDEVNPTLNCPSNMTVNTDPGECGAFVSLPKAAPFDNCGIKNLKSRYRPIDTAASSIGDWSAWGDDQSGFFELGSHEIQWRAKDQSNNKGFCSFTLDIIDEEAPEVVCKDITINFNGEATIAIEGSAILDEAASYDACGPVTVASQSLSEVSCENLGETLTVQIIGQDPNGNTNTCTAQVNVTGMPCYIEATNIDCTEGAAASYDPSTDSFTLEAKDCSGYPDGEISLVSTPLCGDGEIVARVASLTGDGRVGVVMMESQEPGARLVTIVKDLTPRVRTEYRSSTGGSISYKSKTRTGVKWLRIVRDGSKFKTYTSTNGSYWKLAHIITFSSFEDCIYAGLMLYTKDADEPVSAIFDNVKVIGDVPNALVQPSSNPNIFETIASQKAEGLNQNSTIALNVAPNPFAIQTKIGFTLPVAAEVTLELYNLHGQRVQRLENAQLDAGSHHYLWDGKNTAGQSLPTGIYLLRLRINQKWITTKISLLSQ